MNVLRWDVGNDDGNDDETVSNYIRALNQSEKNFN